jgi:hypothetical protein
MARGLLLQVFLAALQGATALPHATQIDDRLAEYRIAGRLDPVRRAREALGFGQR